MKLSELLQKISGSGEYSDGDVSGIYIDSRKVEKNGVFFALKGSEKNGEEFVQEGISRGAIAVISEHPLGIKNNFVVADLKGVLKKVCDRFYNYPLKEMVVIGVTGTNGKTTTAHVTYQLLNLLGTKAGYIGTIGAFWDSKEQFLDNTTPSIIEFYDLLNKMRNDGVRYVVCEVSAHAISQNRLCYTIFDVGVFTNISHDHLDYFHTMNEYRSIKLGFFTSGACKVGVVNVDSEAGRELSIRKEGKIVTYGILNPSDAFGIDFETNEDGQRFVANVMDDVFLVETQLHGEFNRYNLLAAFTVCNLLGFSGKRISKVVKQVRPVEGRFNVYKKDKTVIIDYAHTPDGLENLLTSARKMTGGRVICVFGCGGNRDATKRAVMGKIAEEKADLVILTEDNSRWENTFDIIREIASEMVEKPIIIENRKDAINFAVSCAEGGEIVVIAGKGAEKYIEKRGKREYFSDEIEVKKALGIVT